MGAGSQGAQGLRGPAGPQGLVGPKGDIGPIGPLGPQGPKGDVGPQGIQGIQGIIGLTGTMGPIGLTGADGLIGTMGPRGLTGLTGTMGPIGLTGQIGPIGTMGPIGLSGKDSSPADVAAALIAQNTFLNNLAGTLTSKPFVSQLTGTMGPTGLTGTMGPIGLTGLTGTMGPIGLTGTMGPIGLKGDTGLQGIAGVSPSASDVASSLLAKGNTFINALGSNIVSSASGSQFANNVANVIATGDTAAPFTKLIYDQLSDQNNTFITNLAGTLASNPTYQQMLQGPPGDITNPESLKSALKPKTMWCSNGTFGNMDGNFGKIITNNPDNKNINNTWGGYLCSTPYITSGSLYKIGETPVFNSMTGVYTTNSGIVQIGDWQIYQSTDGNLQFSNINEKIKEPKINTRNINTENMILPNKWGLSVDGNNNLQIVRDGKGMGFINNNMVVGSYGDVKALGSIISDHNVSAAEDINSNRIFSNYVKSNGNLEGNTLTTHSWSDNVAGLYVRGRIYADGNVEGWDLKSRGAFYGRIA